MMEMARDKIIDIIYSISGHRSARRIFSDWVEIMAIQTINATKTHTKEIIERRKNRCVEILFYDNVKKHIINTSQVNSFYKRLCVKAGLEDNGQHSLRHTFATRCIEAGIPPVVIKNWLGHKDIHITLDTYANVFDRMSFTAVNKLEEYIGTLETIQEKIS